MAAARSSIWYSLDDVKPCMSAIPQFRLEDGLCILQWILNRQILFEWTSLQRHCSVSAWLVPLTLVFTVPHGQMISAGLLQVFWVGRKDSLFFWPSWLRTVTSPCLPGLSALVEVYLARVKMFLSVNGMTHKGHAGYLPNHCWRFVSEGRMPYVDIKLILRAFICHWSFQLIFLYCKLPQFIHWPWWACKTASVHLAASSRSSGPPTFAPEGLSPDLLYPVELSQLSLHAWVLNFTCGATLPSC